MKHRSLVVGHGGTGTPHWAPNTDVYTADDGLVINIELAGVHADNMQITVEGNRLRICGQRPDGCRAPNCKFLLVEIHYGYFESSLELPAGYDLSRAKAAYQNGFLRIDVPLAGLATPTSARQQLPLAK